MKQRDDIGRSVPRAARHQARQQRADVALEKIRRR
jgi:hypothetical protein